MIFLCFAFFANVFAWEMIGVQCRKVGQLGGETVIEEKPSSGVNLEFSGVIN